jgi:hypothetical protein
LNRSSVLRIGGHGTKRENKNEKDFQAHGITSDRSWQTFES